MGDPAGKTWRCVKSEDLSPVHRKISWLGTSSVIDHPTRSDLR